MNLKNEHYDLLANKYDEVWEFTEEYKKWVLGHILDKLRCNLEVKLVDIGGGTGMCTKKIATSMSLCNEPICVEPSRGMSEEAAKRGGMFVYNETAEAFTKRDKKYDRVLMKEMIHHVGDRPFVFSNIHRNLNKDGSLLVITRPQNVKMPFFDSLKKAFKEGQPDYVIFVEELEAAGFFVDVVKETHHIKISKSDWFDLLRSRFVSDLVEFLDEDIEIGISELEAKYTENVLMIEDELIFISAFKNKIVS